MRIIRARTSALITGDEHSAGVHPSVKLEFVERLPKSGVQFPDVVVVVGVGDPSAEGIPDPVEDVSVVLLRLGVEGVEGGVEALAGGFRLLALPADGSKGDLRRLVVVLPERPLVPGLGLLRGAVGDGALLAGWAAISPIRSTSAVRPASSWLRSASASASKRSIPSRTSRSAAAALTGRAAHHSEESLRCSRLALQ